MFHGRGSQEFGFPPGKKNIYFCQLIDFKYYSWWNIYLNTIRRRHGDRFFFLNSYSHQSLICPKKVYRLPFKKKLAQIQIGRRRNKKQKFFILKQQITSKCKSTIYKAAIYPVLFFHSLHLSIYDSKCLYYSLEWYSDMMRYKCDSSRVQEDRKKRRFHQQELVKNFIIFLDLCVRVVTQSHLYLNPHTNERWHSQKKEKQHKSNYWNSCPVHEKSRLFIFLNILGVKKKKPKQSYRLGPVPCGRSYIYKSTHTHVGNNNNNIFIFQVLLQKKI